MKVTLREGCQAVLVTDSMQLLTSYLREQKHGLTVASDVNCTICGQICLQTIRRLDGNL